MCTQCRTPRPRRGYCRWRRSPPEIRARSCNPIREACPRSVNRWCGGDEMAGAEFEFLASGAQRHALVRIRGSGKIHECLMDFESVLVGEARSADASVFDAALKLREESDMASGVPIGVEQVALQQES